MKPGTRRERLLPRAALLACTVGLGVVVVLGDRIGGALALPAAFAAYQWLRRQPTPAQRREALQIETDLPFAADLLAAVLRAGAPPDAAAHHVGRALGGPLGERLLRVRRALQLGASAAEAWGHLGEQPVTTRLVAAVTRSQRSGAALAGALTRIADDLRAERVAGADAAGNRAGVLIVLPLGLCFLPAFVLAGLVPVIVAVIGDVLSTH